MDPSDRLDARRVGGTPALLLAAILVALLVVLTALRSQSYFSERPEPEGAAGPMGSSAPMQANGEPEGARALPETPVNVPTDSAEVSWVLAQVPQGSIFQLRVAPETGQMESVEGTFSGEPLHFRVGEGGTFFALAAAPVDAQGEVDLQLEIRYATAAAEIRFLKVPVVPGEYRMERLAVAPEFGRPQPAEIQRRINDESARAMQVSRSSHDTPRVWDAPFLPPRETRITSGFGHGRMFNEEVQSRHMGTDFEGAVGALVLAPARGRVALVDAFYLGGNVIYLDHGDGLVTAYLHLSEQEVEEGQVVEPGQVTGRVGATGRVTGPHLHWIVRYGVITVDGMSLLDIG